MIDKIYNILNQYIHSTGRDKILSVLPCKGEKTKEGLTVEEIAQRTSLPRARISSELQYLKKHYKVRLYNGRKWRQSEGEFLSF